MIKSLGIKAGIVLSVIALVGALGVLGCSPQTTSTSSSDDTTVEQSLEYTSDEACLSCHEGSYEDHALTTAQYGEWNPHDSIHGGYNACNNCHDRCQELTYNWCSNCHTYSAEGSTYYEDPLFLTSVE